MWSSSNDSIDVAIEGYHRVVWEPSEGVIGIMVGWYEDHEYICSSDDMSWWDFPSHIYSCLEFPGHIYAPARTYHPHILLSRGFPDHQNSSFGNIQITYILKPRIPTLPYSLVGSIQAHIPSSWGFPDPHILQWGIPKPPILSSWDVPAHIYSHAGNSQPTEILQSEISRPHIVRSGKSRPPYSLVGNIQTPHIVMSGIPRSYIFCSREVSDHPNYSVGNSQCAIVTWLVKSLHLEFADPPTLHQVRNSLTI